MPEFTIKGVQYPIAGDLIKDDSVVAKLARDLKSMATSADTAIAVEGERVETASAINAAKKANAAKSDAISDATSKYGELPNKVSTLEAAPAKSSEKYVGADLVFVEVDEDGVVSRSIDKQGRTWVNPHPDTPGKVDAEVAKQLHPLPNGGEWAYAVTDETGKIGFGIRSDGSTTLGGAATTSPGYDLIFTVGQSNQSGAGMPVNEETSPIHPRVFQFPSITKPEYGQIIPAVEPLLHYGPIVGVTGTGPTMEFARQWADAHPDRKVLIIAAAKSGSGFTTYNDMSWDLNTTAPIPLGRIAIQLAKDAVAAAGEGSKIVATTWVQGEADGGLGGPTYQTYLDEFFTDGVRAELGADIPIIVGQMSPERNDMVTSAREIDKVHMGTPGRLLRSAFAYAPRGALNPGGVTHFSSRGTVLLGRSMFEAYQRAIRNDGTRGAVRVENLRVDRSFDAVTLRWDQPYATTTGYTIEWSTNDGTTWAATGVERYFDLDTAATVTSDLPVAFRITAHNNVADSEPQTIKG